MKLFHVQDSDRPLYIVADDFSAAVTRWRQVILAENEGEFEPGELPDPDGVSLVCDDDELDFGYEAPNIERWQIEHRRLLDELVEGSDTDYVGRRLAQLQSLADMAVAMMSMCRAAAQLQGASS